MDEIVIVALKNGQIMIGKPQWDNEENKINALTSPRIIITKEPDQIRLLEVYGAPDFIRLDENPIYTGAVTDKEMIRGYIKATTSLVLPN
jgi:chemotaxis signal transduction protein